MRQFTFTLALIAALGLAAFHRERTFAAGGPLLKFTIHQTATLQNPFGLATAYQKTFVQREDGTYAQTETSYVDGSGLCESGASFTATSKISYNTCTQAKSTFPANREVDRQNQLRRQSTCAAVFAGAKLVNHGTMFGVRTEEFAYDDKEQKGLYIASPDLACATLSETHFWRKNDGSLSGAITLLATTSLNPEADERPFAVAKAFQEMKPSEARNVWAAKLHRTTTAAYLQRSTPNWMNGTRAP